MRPHRMFLAAAALAVPFLAQARDTPLIEDTPAAACEVLKKHMARLMRLPGGKPDASWFCDHVTDKNEFLYIMGLRSNPHADHRESGTVPLIGWFAVARRSNVVLQLDMAENRLVPVSSAYARR